MAVNRGPSTLAAKIQKCLSADLTSDLVEVICRNLQTMRNRGYGRRIIQDINNKPLRLFDEMMRKGDITVTDYGFLLELLTEADLTDVSSHIQEIIDQHEAQHNNQASQFVRPDNLPVQSTHGHSGYSLKSPTPSEFYSPDHKRRRMSSQGRADSAESVFPDTNPSRQHYGKDYYPLEENLKGLVAVINNFTDEEDPRYRLGTKEDQKGIVHLFRRPDFAAHYTVEDPRENLNMGEFNSYMNSLVTKLTAHPENYSSFFLFVLSHGDENGVHAYYKANCDQPDVIPYDEIAKKFSNCLPGRPKVFIIQACQGRFDNSVDEVAADAISPTAGNCLPNDEDSEVDSDGSPIDTGLPDAADMLSAFASVKGYKSYRVKNGEGSWFIQKLLTELKEAHSSKYYSTHLLDLLTQVQLTVAMKKGKATPDGEPRKKVIVKQMPCFQSSLRKKFYLLPPVLPS